MTTATPYRFRFNDVATANARSAANGYFEVQFVVKVFGFTADGLQWVKTPVGPRWAGELTLVLGTAADFVRVVDAVGKEGNA